MLYRDADISETRFQQWNWRNYFIFTIQLTDEELKYQEYIDSLARIWSLFINLCQIWLLL